MGGDFPVAVDLETFSLGLLERETCILVVLFMIYYVELPRVCSNFFC